MDIDRNGVVWTVLVERTFASFDRRKCKGPLNGPTATGKQCPEGWTLYPCPGRSSRASQIRQRRLTLITIGSISSTRSGLGKNVPIATGQRHESLLPLVNGKFVDMRIPYPMGFFAQELDGRIDDPKPDGKGEGCGPPTRTRTVFHIRRRQGHNPKVYKFQLRPDPLAH